MTAIRKVTKKWTQKDGTKIRICDMSDSHLVSTIKMLKRSHQATISAAYSFESTLSGEMACDAMESEIASLESVESDCPLFEDLTDEFIRRNPGKELP